MLEISTQNNLPCLLDKTCNMYKHTVYRGETVGYEQNKQEKITQASVKVKENSKVVLQGEQQNYTTCMQNPNASLRIAEYT